jgi:hypothetical protein
VKRKLSRFTRGGNNLSGVMYYSSVVAMQRGLKGRIKNSRWRSFERQHKMSDGFCCHSFGSGIAMHQ